MDPIPDLEKGRFVNRICAFLRSFFIVKSGEYAMHCSRMYASRIYMERNSTQILPVFVGSMVPKTMDLATGTYCDAPAKLNLLAAAAALSRSGGGMVDMNSSGKYLPARAFIQDRELPDMMSTKILNFFTPSPLVRIWY